MADKDQKPPPKPTPLSALMGAQTIGPPRVGVRYDLPTWGEIIGGRNPLMGLLELVMGNARAPSVAAADPYGIEAAEMGAGPPPIFMGTTQPLGTGEKALDTALDLSHAGRMRRAADLGFTQDVYHGTQRKWSWMDDPAQMERFNRGEDIIGPTSDALHAFQQNRGGGLKMMDGMGVHAGTARAAQERLETNVGAKFGTPKRAVDPGALRNAYVIPLKGRAQRPFTKGDGSPYTESQLQSRLSAIAKQLGYTDTRAYSAAYPASAKMREAQRAVKKHLQEQGYDSIPYINSHEDRGSVSWVFFEPNQLRSPAAKFDPRNLASSDLLASLVGGITLSELARGRRGEQ